jgi:hypothetical protein
MIKYKNYEIHKDDAKNWKLERFDNSTRPRDVTDNDGKITAHKGEAYIKWTFLGFYSDVGTALSGIVKDAAGVGCKTISELSNQLNQLEKDLAGLIK